MHRSKLFSDHLNTCISVACDLQLDECLLVPLHLSTRWKQLSSEKFAYEGKCIVSSANVLEM